MLKDWNKLEVPAGEEVENRLKAAREMLLKQQVMMKEKKLPVIVLFEGWGAAGKGSVLGKVIKNIDPRFFKVAVMDEPTEDEIKALETEYKAIRDGYRIQVKNTLEATKMIVKHQEIFRDYEVVKGGMDDVFLAVTGKILGGGQ